MTSLRSFVPLEAEYRLRHMLNVGAAQPGQPTVVHVATWKTASQWLRMVLSDPGLMRATGYRAQYVRGRTGAPGLDAEMVTPSTVLTPVYASSDHPLLPADCRIVTVVREPVALARSWLHTNMTAHPSNPDVDRRRVELNTMRSQGVDPAGLLAASLADGFAETLRISSSWIERASVDTSVHVVRFEELTNPARQRDALAQIFRHIGFDQQVDRLDLLMKRYDRGRLGRLERLVKPSGQRKYASSDVNRRTDADLSNDEIRELMASAFPELLGPVDAFYSANELVQ